MALHTCLYCPRNSPAVSLFPAVPGSVFAHGQKVFSAEEGAANTQFSGPLRSEERTASFSRKLMMDPSRGQKTASDVTG